MVNLLHLAVLITLSVIACNTEKKNLIFATDWEYVILENDETDQVSLVTSAQLHFFHHEDTHAHNNEASEEGRS